MHVCSSIFFSIVAGVNTDLEMHDLLRLDNQPDVLSNKFGPESEDHLNIDRIKKE